MNSPIKILSTQGERVCSLALVIALTLFLCGCSSFNRAWKQAGSTPAPPDSIEGRWDGRWLSAANGHTGNLRCLITKKADGPYEARFRASYMKVLRFSYKVPLTVTRTNESWQFRGEADLGKMAGGVYHYEGSTTATQFHSTYRSKYDHGDFELARPAVDVKPAN